jgi:hypothetical protein
MANTLTKTKKILTPASIVSQKKWASLPVKKKNTLRKMLPDKDKDGVPNKYDCRPNNKRKQEAFLSQDNAYLSSTSHIEPDKYIDEGLYGAVYTVKKNPNLVVKVPIGFVPNGKSVAERRNDVLWCADSINKEADIYNELGLEKQELFSPTRIVNLGRTDVSSEGFIGLVRPRVKVADKMDAKVTQEQLEALRRKIINISHKGYALMDGVQVGFDSTGRILQYDLDGVEKVSINEAFIENNISWLSYLHSIGKIGKYNSVPKGIMSTCLLYCRGVAGKYGIIDPREHHS